MKRLLIGLLTVVLLITAAGCSPDAAGDSSDSVEKRISVTVVKSDGERAEFTELSTTRVYLADALYDSGFLDEDEYRSGDGLYTIILGQTANYDRDAAWWCVTVDGEMATVGMNELEIVDGAAYELVYTVG